MADKNKKIGVMMSGGLDSSAIAISLKENNYEDVITYSANFDHVKDSSDIDETIFQRIFMILLHINIPRFRWRVSHL